MPTSPPADPRATPHPAPAPEIEPVAPDALRALEPEWAALWHRCPGATAFQSPAWLLPWARHFAPGRTAAVALRHEGRLAGLLPVFTWADTMLLAGTGPSDRADLLLEPGLDAAVPALLAALPALDCGPWSRLDLQQLPPTSPLLHAPAPAGWATETHPGEPCHVTHLAGTDGLAAASKRRRSNWRYAIRRLEREGGTLALVPRDQIVPATDDLIRLHTLRWQANGQPGIFADPLLRAFLRDATPALAEAGLLRLHEFRFGQDRAALLLALATRDAHAYYIAGFDPAHARLSPSAALVGTAMTLAHREGASTFDFLRGAEAYKGDWGATPQPTHRRVLTLRG
jgi:CelD/BcsL family acetyltransferase involved in cellulose biosynthesis